MKHFLTCALCFVSLPVVAMPLYYDRNNTCDGWHTSNSCDSPTVTKVNVKNRSESVFNGFYISAGNRDVMIFDGDGNIQPDALANIRAANITTGSRASQSYTCQTRAKNKHGACVDPDTAYIDIGSNDFVNVDVNNHVIEFGDPNGYQIPYTEVNDDRGGESWHHYFEFDVVIHWCPETYGNFEWSWANTPPKEFVGWPASDAPDWTGLPCTTPPTTYHYSWPLPHEVFGDPEHSAEYLLNNVLATQIQIPTATGWTFRGFYIYDYSVPDAAGNIIPESDLAARCPTGQHEYSNGHFLGLGSNCGVTCLQDCIIYWGKRNTAALELVTTKSNNYSKARIGLRTDDTGNVVTINDIAGYFPNTRWSVLSDQEIPRDYKVHLYAGWAKNCDPSGGATCTLDINRIDQYGDSGDTTYTTTCASGTPVNNGTYHPVCTNTSRDIVYVDEPYVCTVSVGTDSCTPGQSYSLPAAASVTCGPKWTAVGWGLSQLGAIAENYSLGETLTCNNTYLGTEEPATFILRACVNCAAYPDGQDNVVACRTPENGCGELECEYGYHQAKEIGTGGYAELKCVADE